MRNMLLFLVKKNLKKIFNNQKQTKEEYKIDGCYIINFLDEKLGDEDE